MMREGILDFWLVTHACGLMVIATTIAEGEGRASTVDDVRGEPLPSFPSVLRQNDAAEYCTFSQA